MSRVRRRTLLCLGCLSATGVIVAAVAGWLTVAVLQVAAGSVLVTVACFLPDERY